MSDTDLVVAEGVPYTETCIVEMPGVSVASTGYTSRLTIARAGESLLVVEEGAAIITTALDQKVQIDFGLSAAQSALVSLSRVEYQLDLLLDGEIVLRPLVGRIVVQSDVTTG